MGLLMTKTQPLLSPFFFQHAVFVGVCLPAPWQAGLPVRTRDTEAPLRRRHHRKSIGIELNLYPQAILSLTKQSILLCSALLCGLIQHVLRLGSGQVYPAVAPDRLFSELDCFQALRNKRYTSKRDLNSYAIW